MPKRNEWNRSGGSVSQSDRWVRGWCLQSPLRREGPRCRSDPRSSSSITPILRVQGSDTAFRFVPILQVLLQLRPPCCLFSFYMLLVALSWPIHAIQAGSATFFQGGDIFTCHAACARSCSYSVPAPAHAPIGYRTDGGKIPPGGIYQLTTTRVNYTKSAILRMSADRCGAASQPSPSPAPAALQLTPRHRGRN